MAHRGQLAGPLNPNWKGGRTVAEHGYVLIKVGVDHPLADVRGYAYEHRLVMSEKIGRWVTPEEEVHHKDENRSNNHPDNLELKASHAEHALEHRVRQDLRLPEEPNPDIECSCGCGASFPRYDESNRPRRFVPGHNPPPPAPTIQAVIAALKAGPLHRRELRRRIGASMHAVAVCLTKLKGRGLVRQCGPGVWGLSEG
jgi:hypothetical protein